jgi:non-specific serine/threonine protein kinase
VTLRRIESGTLKPSKELAGILLEKLGIPETERPQWISFARGLSSFPAQSPPSLTKSKSNLPTPLTTFIGREKEQADVIGLITKHRLVTLTGSGGVGKTRLSIIVVEQVLENYANGVWLVELAPILDPLLVPRTIALTLGLRDDPQRSTIDLLSDYLREKRMLILIDNCEHVLEACAQLIDTMLKSCPDLKILATSREPLNIAGEAIYRVPSLGLPNLQQILDTFKNYESIQLFEERAQLVQFDFSLTLENATSVAQICQRLDGIPLAIELAAAKVAVFSTEQIAKQLHQSFNLLVGGSRTALPRQQTLRASISWSWNLLTEAEQRLMRQLSVFVGGWTLEAAQSVCDGDVLKLLNSLVTKSLVVMNQRAETGARYSFHETIRQYAHEKLEESGESEVVRGRHLDFFLTVALRFEQEAHGSHLLSGIVSVNAEHDNLLEAMNWAGESGRSESGLRLGSALHYYWLCRGYWSVGRGSLERLLTSPQATEHTTARAEALNLAADLATQQGDLAAARTWLEESIVIGRELGEVGKPYLAWARMILGETWMSHDKVMAQSELDQSVVLFRERGESWRLAIALVVRGWLAASQGDMRQARDFYRESLDILLKVGDAWTSADPTGALGWVYYCLGEYDTAVTYLQQALAIYRVAEDKFSTPGIFANLGCIALLQGDDRQGIAYFETSLSIARQAMNNKQIAGTLGKLGIAFGHCGEYARARMFFREGLELSQETGDIYLVATCLTGLAGIQQAHRATKMFAAAQAALARSGEFIEPFYRVERDRIENKIRDALNAQEVEKLWEEGRAMTIEQAIALALESV